MEQSLGKRIVHNRKKLNLTQDQLAEKLGVTAQAVSKWENDQSCPDITMLPKLAEIFGISIDELLGAKQPPVRQAEVVGREEAETDGIHIQKGGWEFKWDSGRRSAIGFACWVLLLGALLLVDVILKTGVGFWSLAWPSALVMLGLFGGKRFSFFRLGCVLLGAWFLLDHVGLLPAEFGSEILWPALVLLFGVGLLADALRKPKRPHFSFSRTSDPENPDSHAQVSRCEMQGNTFECENCFGDGNHFIRAQLLERGEIENSFGATTVDLSGVEAVAENCSMDIFSNFGEVIVLVPRQYAVRLSPETAFGTVHVKGEPDVQPRGIITMECSANFGSIVIQYI